MKINRKRFPLTGKSCLLMLFFACMFVFASFTREDRQKVREFKKDLMSKLVDKKDIDLLSEVSDEEPSKKSLSTNAEKKLSQDILSKNNPFQKEVGDSGLSGINNEISTNVISYPSREKEGTIGTFSDKEEDRISDNFFTVDVPVVNKENTVAYLEYDLFGLASHQSVPRSINHNVAIGGDIVVPSAQWSHQREALSSNLIKNGLNTILFTSPSDGVKYKVKNLKIVFDKDQKSYDNIVVSSVLSGDKLYVKGNNISGAGATINNENVSVKNGEFEKLIQLSESDKAKGNFSITSNGITNNYKIPTEINSFKTSNNTYFNAKGISVSKDQEFSVDYEGINIKVEKETSEAAYLEVLKLRSKDFPPTSQGLKNVTVNNSAYRLSVISGKLNKKIKVTLPYDEKRLGLIPAKEIKIFHFDYAKRQWAMDKSAVVDTKTKTVTVEGDGNTDYINGVISTPESPQLNAFAPTSISGLKAGDPMAAIQMMSPPTANQKGDANMNYPINVPSGLGGLEPSLSIGYSSGGSNGWMGEGWDVQGVSGITIDTRWGAPQFDGSTETELYSMDGEMLVYPNNYLPHRHNDVSETSSVITTDKQPRASYATAGTNGVKQFYLRKNHDFSIIERIGDNPTNYSWKVTSTDGTKSYYGGTTESTIKNSSNQIVHWALRRIEDVHGNSMNFTYQNTTVNFGTNNNNSNLNGGVYFHIKQISYGKNGDYTVNFNTETGLSRTDLSINGKQGVKRVEPYLLKNVTVNYQGSLIRTYKMEYETGQFSKTRLKRLYLDGGDSPQKYALLGDYDFEYYDDVADGSIYGPSTTIQVNNAKNVFGGLVQGLLTPSRISGNSATETGFNFRAAAGLNLYYPSNDAYGHIMFGLPFGFSNTEAKTMQQLIDFNGDGIQDMIYKDSGGLYFSQGSLANGALSFGSPQPLLNFNSNFSLTKSKSSSSGWDMGLFIKSRSMITSKSTSTTSTYLTDGNSDGVMDIVHNGEVWFNAGQNTPEMTKHSEYTENMILKAKAIAVPYNPKTDPPLQEPITPTVDVVKVWIAPKDGYIRFTDQINLGLFSYITPFKVLYSVEILNPIVTGVTKHGRIYMTELDQNNGPSSASINIERYNDYYSQIQGMLPTNIDHFGINNGNRLYVKSGEKVYIRLHKNKDFNAEVTSNPKVTYVDANGNELSNTFELAQDQFYLNNGSYSDNFFLNNEMAPVYLDTPGTAEISVGSVIFPYSTSDFKFKIYKDNINANTTQEIYSQSFPQSDVSFGTGSILQTVTVNSGEPVYLRFVVESDSHVASITSNWQGKINVQYTANTPTAANPAATTFVEFNTVPQYPSYAITQFSEKFNVKNYTSITGTHDFKAQIKKNITNFSTLGVGSFYYIIKRGNTAIAKRKVIVDNTNNSIEEQDMILNQPISGVSPVTFYTGSISGTLLKPWLITIQVYCNTGADYALFKSYSNYFSGKPFNIYYDNNILITDTSHTSINSAMYSSKTKLFNNWGQFLFNQDQAYPVITGTTDGYGTLINPEALSENPTTQPLYSSCSQQYPNPNQQQLLAECIANSMANPSNGNSTAVVISPMKPYLLRQRNRFLPRWIGTAPEQFTSAISFKDDDTQPVYFTNPNPDPAPAVIQSMGSTQLSIDTTMKAIDRKTRSTSRNTTDGVAISQINTNAANSITELQYPGSVVTQDFMDMNGDGYPDMVYAESRQLTSSTGGLRDGETNPVFGYPTDSYSLQEMNSVGFSYNAYSVGGRTDAFGTSSSSAKPDMSLSWSAGVSVSAGVNKYFNSTDYAKEYYLDINGDGLPDRVRNGGTSGVTYSLNLGKNFTGNDKFENLVSYRSHPIGGVNVSIGGGLSASLQSLSSFGFGITASVGASSSKGSSDVLYEDINGDGMTDILEVNHGNKTTAVRYNLGNKFDIARPLLRSASAIDFTEENQSYNGSLSFGGNLMINFGPITIVPILPILILYIKAGAGANANFGINVSEVKKIFKDMNGDGYADLVMDNGGNAFTVNYSRIGRTNKLKQVTSRITQSKYTVDYQFTQPTYQDPHAKLVVKEVKVLNPDVFDTNYTNSNASKDMVTRYTFENSKYDRRERDSFGFETVTLEEMLDANNAYRKTVDTYYNSSYFFNGLLKSSQIFDTGGLISEVNNTYKLYKFVNNASEIDVNNAILNPSIYDTGGKEGRRMAIVLLSKKSKIAYETGGSIQTSEEMFYNSKGHLKKYQYTSPTKIYNSEIDYWDGLNNNIVNVPKEIRVYEGTGNSNLLRQRKNLNINPNNGDIGAYAAFDGSNDIETDYTYDSYGNIATVEYPPNEAGQRYTLYYQYDNATSKYVTIVTDNFGLTSTSEYYPKYDAVKKSVDMTGNTMEYGYDGCGRMTSVTSPNDYGSNHATINYSYYYENFGIPNTNIAVKIFKATTSHYVAETPANPIRIDTYADMLGRVIQVKKDVEINGVERRSVSGRPIFDKFGRTIRQYQPYDEPIGTNSGNINVSFPTIVYSTASVYDASDRVIQAIDEDNQTKFTKYAINGSLFKTTVEFDVMKSETYTNAEEKIMYKLDYLGNVPLKTSYEYNSVGELVTVTDPEGISTSYEYDLAGKRVGMSHPDKGKTTYEYDAAGSLVRFSTPNLSNDPNISTHYIHYLYDHNRLTDIELPSLPDGSVNPNNVHYGYLNGGYGNNSGRMYTKSDGTGYTVYTYGRMGEVVSENRTVFGYNIPTMNFQTFFNYDSWNRIKQITYPDNENVYYRYDLGGNLKSVSNDQQDYIKEITYDLYGQKTKVTYGNGVVNRFNYVPTKRRLSTATLANSSGIGFLANSYRYDYRGNIAKLENHSDVSPNGMGGQYVFEYKYDTLNRLIGTEGSSRLVDKAGNPITPGTSPFSQSNSGFKLHMEYNDAGGILEKNQEHSVDQVVNQRNTYHNKYEYIDGTHKIHKIGDSYFGNSQDFKYDENGNTTMHKDEYRVHEMSWDEQDRLKALSDADNGLYQYYMYDDKGERTIKYSLIGGSQLYQNGALVDPGSISIDHYKLYPNPYVVVTSDGQYTKNYFEGTTRFASRIEPHNDIFIPTTIKAPNKDTKEINPETDFRTYLQKMEIDGAVSSELGTEKAPPGMGGQPGLYYLHGDHLGTASFVTDDNSETTQFFLNLPFGETMLEQQSGVYDNPYKFNAKELDSETGLYYYGARYYNPRVSTWYGVDPLAVYNPVMETQFYGDGQHNGGVYNLGNLNPYIYTYQNPIKYIDPNGKQNLSVWLDDAIDWVHDEIKPVRRFYRWSNNKDNISDKQEKIILEASPLGGLVKFRDFVDKLYPYVKPQAGINKPCGCFTSGTQVLTENGYKNIEDIREGDLVWAYDDQNADLKLKKVINTITLDFSQIYKLYIGTEVIEATHEHPFFVGGKWLKVDELKVGDNVTLYDGTIKRIDKIEFISHGNFKVHNFEVEDYHSYFVGENKILVHNGNPCAYEPINLPKGRDGQQIKGAAQINKAIKDLAAGRYVEPRLDDDTSLHKQYDVSRTRNPSATQILFDGALEYKVDVPGVGDNYRLLYKASINQATGKWEEHVGYTYDHYRTIHEVKKK
ncbi:RHS repeat-associated protein [Chryseobacterium ginsenosidimutans]|uniref:SpvB/TcaC N-terminal domain-containing protein n=1 Tax=Chryseobacterium ginsenosidimutans TaxID=687846 RepID=UPI002789D613|nr:SpvB/TcaC N-terminal domain-containing protein [Chryseobacterium ginsenosidimutans]MDQ0593659.1 RHS repeat-associated protein [Chryseobacterium ginsenosidimutans]